MLCTAKKTVEAIIESGNHYCIGLKANQAKLLHQAQVCAHTQAPLSDYQDLDCSHGRVVQRRVQVFAAPEALAKQWRGLAGFVWVERSGVREGKAFERQSWFIISQLIEAQQAAAMIRGHRAVTENKLHWVKDVVQGEDASMIRAANPATLLGILRSWAATVFRRAGHASITRATRRFCHNLPALLSFL